MADPADFAAENEAQHLAVSLSRITAAIPAGAAGECDNCGDHFARLVGGLCGFCRDGRRRLTADRVDRPATTPIPATPSPEDDDVPNPPPGDNFQNVSILARDHVLRAIRARAATDGLSLNKAAIALIEAGLATPAPAPIAAPTGIDLSDVDAVMDEIRRYWVLGIEAHVEAAERARDAAIAEVAALTAKFDAVRAALSEIQ